MTEVSDASHSGPDVSAVSLSERQHRLDAEWDLDILEWRLTQ